MEVNNQIKLKFHGVDFPIINLNSINPKDKEDIQIDINITPKIFYPKENPNFFKIIQEIKLTSENYFDLFIVGVGTFELDFNIDDKLKTNFVNQNAPAIMFPYLRSFISTLTSNLGQITGTLTIPPQFFKGELEIIEELN